MTEWPDRFRAALREYDEGRDEGWLLATVARAYIEGSGVLDDKAKAEAIFHRMDTPQHPDGHPTDDEIAWAKRVTYDGPYHE